MKRYIPTIALALFLLAGCAGASQDAVLASSCEGFNRTLEALNPFVPSMSEGQLASLDKAVEIVPPACNAGRAASASGDPYDYAGAIESVRLYLRRLVIIQQEVE